MKGVPIKFRGKDCITDEYIFGDVIHKDKGVYIGAMTAEGYAMSEVYPDSVAQLCGYDANGKEVYEDDKLIHWFEDFQRTFIDKYGGSCRAALRFDDYLDWVDKRPKSCLTTEEVLKNREEYIKKFKLAGELE